MDKPYSKCIYHLIWTTIHREDLISPKIETFLKIYIPKKILQYGGVYYECNMVQDHIHILCEIPSPTSISAFIGKLKGSTSHEINRKYKNTNFAWQSGYSIFSVGRTEIDMITNYIKRQKIHHQYKQISPFKGALP